MPEKQWFKVLVNGKSCHGGNLEWSLPTKSESGEWTPGAWHEVTGNLAICNHPGIHLTCEPAKWVVDGCEFFIAEYDGETKNEGDDKISCRKVRLLRVASATELAAVRVYTVGEHNLELSGCEKATIATLGSSQATIKTWDSSQATIKTWGSSQATVETWDSSQATIATLGSSQATVETWDSSQATVETLGSSQATVETWDSSQATVETWDSSQATVETWDSSQATIKTWGSSQATVETWDSSQATIATLGSSQATIKTWDSSQATIATLGSSQATKSANEYAVLIDRTTNPPKVLCGWMQEVAS